MDSNKIQLPEDMVALIQEARTKSEFLARQEWLRNAACRNIDVLTDEEKRHAETTNEDLECLNQRKLSAIFHPGQGESVADAKKICSNCPVRKECFEYALLHSERHGVWGGAADRTRRRIRRMRRKVKQTRQMME